MKINFTDYPDVFGENTDFVNRPVKFFEEDAILVFPASPSAKFTQRNKIFRSSIWSLNGELLSAGFPKFKNHGEDPEEFPSPDFKTPVTVRDKIDGSLVIVDFEKSTNRINARTRGTPHFSFLDNAPEFHRALKKYNWDGVIAHAKSFFNTTNISLLFEFTTPSVRIVVDYGANPQLTLIGIIRKDTYTIVPQDHLNYFVEQVNNTAWYGVKLTRVTTYPDINSHEDLIRLLNDLNSRDDIVEGVCVYHTLADDNIREQYITKLKTEKYLRLHRLKSDVGNIKKVIDILFSLSLPLNEDLQELYDHLVNEYDFEIAEHVKQVHFPTLKILIETVNLRVSILKQYIELNKTLSQKEFALKVQRDFKEFKNEQSRLFLLKSKGNLNKEAYQKLTLQILHQHEKETQPSRN